MEQIKKRAKKAGFSPGSRLHVGEKNGGSSVDETKLAVFDYDGDNLSEHAPKTIEDYLSIEKQFSVRWLNVEGIHESVHNVKILEILGRHYGFHPLTLEDILNTNQRPKVEVFDNCVFIVLKMLSYDNDNGAKVRIEQVSLILGTDFVISFQEGTGGNVFDVITNRLRKGHEQLRKSGADFLIYSLMDSIVDNYFVILEMISDKIEELEEDITQNPSPGNLQALHALKRHMIFMQKSVWPLREVLSTLERNDCKYFQSTTKRYLQDIYDHTIQVIDVVEIFRDMLSGMLDVYLSSISNRMNAIMKVLTIVSTIFMPLTFIVGVYGMNFKNMPELQWEWGYVYSWSLMLTVVIVMVVFFKRKKWL
ncbi:MAG: magnesium/cobalt transporter CorA [Nitrospirae bacterium]|nr:magnesium/cobalt transporter CorA [Nitrospirota bacterium]